MITVERIRNLTPQSRALLLERLLPSSAMGDQKQITAYVVPKPGHPVSEADLRDFVSTHLPDIMVPNELFFLESLPHHPNGKVDRQTLPRFGSAPVSMQTTFTAPANDAEMRLARIWADLLQVESVGVNDNFFRLGGHSLLALQVMARVREIFHTDLPLKILFEHPTVAGLAKALACHADSVQPIRRIPRRTGASVEPSLSYGD